MDEEKPPLPLTSDAWIRELRPWIGKRIEYLRDELEREGTNVPRTRGQIEELRFLMRQVEPDLAEDGASASYFPQGNSPT